VGAGSWITNYNVLLLDSDMAAARAVARAVSERGGGLPGLQAMALRHADGIEVACNLLQPATTPPGAVLDRIGQLAAQHGLTVGPGYCTNKTPEELATQAVKAGL
jgi:glutamate formiminotransferase